MFTFLQNTRSRSAEYALIRHFAALLVLYSHHYPLSGSPEPTMPRWDTYGFLAVAIFFSISGYFMPQSYKNPSGFMDFMDFMAKRCRLIFPGLIVCSFIMVFVVGAIFTSMGLLDYLFSSDQIKTFIMFSSLSGRTIPTVFSNFIFKDAINGSLWTLPVEFLCYLIIGCALSIYWSWKMVLGLFWIACTSSILMKINGFDFAFYGVPMSYLSMFGVAFTMGALLSMTKASWMPYRFHILFIALLIIGLMRGRLEIQTLGLASIAVITIVAGTFIKDNIISGKFDISYGVYIYAFPIQQIVTNCITENFWISFLLSSAGRVRCSSLTQAKRSPEYPGRFIPRSSRRVSD